MVNPSSGHPVVYYNLQVPVPLCGKVYLSNDPGVVAGAELEAGGVAGSGSRLRSM